MLPQTRVSTLRRKIFTPAAMLTSIAPHFSLPLTLSSQGATLLYTAYLGPFLRAHEGDIDVALASARRRASEVAGNWIMTIWQQLRSAILGAAVSLRHDSPRLLEATQMAD